MCRLVAYLGNPALLKKVLVDPDNSLIRQSLHARETVLRTNGDGFGVGWYNPNVSSDPALFTSIAPAWNDRNLLHLTAKIVSPCFFAHVRSASAGGVTNYNCHPFVFGDWMLMHNGEIHNFISVKRHVRRLLDDDIYHWIKGETDSEHLFALFLQYAKGRDLTQISEVGDVLVQTLIKIEELVRVDADKGTSYFNICLTDGKRVIATRYCSFHRKKPLSLHYLLGNTKNSESTKQPSYVVISSEKLTDIDEDWVEVPVQHMVLVNHDREIALRPLNLS